MEEEEEGNWFRSLDPNMIRRIKLKLPTIAAPDDRFYCDGDFSSGKRIRPQPTETIPQKPNKKLLKKPPEPGLAVRSRVNNVNGGAAQIAEEDETTCSLCPKRFKSMKSLFGHMRCHPERHWRGINPPPPPPPPALSGWSVTGRRGRKRAAGGGSVSESGNSGQIVPIDDHEDSNSEIDDNTNWGSPADLMELEETELLREEDGPEESEAMKVNQRKITRKRKKKKRLRDLEIAENNYKCTICSKTFSTHQALGGHKASHNKHNNKMTQIVDESGPMDQRRRHVPTTQLVGEDIEEEEEEEEATVLHQCNICDKTFPSGQALGGHMRSHWIAPPPPAGSTQVTASAGEASHNGPKILSFDLNYPPPMDQDDDDDEGIADSAFFNPSINMEL